jgi:hypothetical protein
MVRGGQQLAAVQDFLREIAGHVKVVVRRLETDPGVPRLDRVQPFRQCEFLLEDSL